MLHALDTEYTIGMGSGHTYFEELDHICRLRVLRSTRARVPEMHPTFSTDARVAAIRRTGAGGWRRHGRRSRASVPSWPLGRGHHAELEARYGTATL